MSDEVKTVDESTQEEETVEQTVTREQFEELQRQLEETRKAQSGSDRTVKELQDRLKQKEQEVEETKKTSQEKLQEEISKIKADLEAEREAKHRAELRGYANELLSEAGMKTKLIDRFIGQDLEETEANIKLFIDEEKERRAKDFSEYARKNGRTIQDSNEDGGLLTKEQIAERMKVPGWYEKNKDLVRRSEQYLAGGNK